MFLSFLVPGLKIFSHWETYAAGLALLVSLFIPIAFIGIAGRNKACKGFGFRCMSVFVLPALQVLGVTVFVLTLAPLILGFSESAAWGFPWKMISLAPMKFAIFIASFSLVAVISANSRVMRKLHSFQTMIIGCISLILVQKFISLINPVLDIDAMSLFPGFSFVGGILFMTWIMSTAGFYVSGFVGATLENRLNMGKGIMELLIFPFAVIFGIIPVFIYGAWLA